MSDDFNPNVPKGLEIIPGASSDGAHVYLRSLHYTKTDTDSIVLGPWSIDEAGDIAYTLLQAIPRAIAANLELIVLTTIDDVSEKLEARLDVRP